MEHIDFTFPIYGSKDQTKYHGGFGYRALIESPGILLVVNTDKQFEYENSSGPSKATIASVLSCLIYILVMLSIAYLSGFILWLLVSKIFDILFLSLWRMFHFWYHFFLWTMEDLCFYIFQFCMLVDY